MTFPNLDLPEGSNLTLKVKAKLFVRASFRPVDSDSGFRYGSDRLSPDDPLYSVFCGWNTT